MNLQARWLAIVVVAMRTASADTDPTPAPAPPTTSDVPRAGSESTPPPAIKLGGYVELYSELSFQQPSNGIVNLRAFNARDRSLALQNAVLDATWTKGPISGRIAFQIGEAGDSYYASEPVRPAMGSVPATGPTEWRHVQEAWVAWAIPCAKLELAGGLFLSPIGPEVVPTRDDWNWSRSNVFFSLPYYHTGIRAKRTLGESGWSAIAGVYNGWNSVIDNNRTPSVSFAAAYAKSTWIAQVLYFGGIERSEAVPEGSPWRHLVDGYVQGALGGGWSFLAHADAGFERGTLGTSSWLGAAAYVRYDLTKTVWAAGRGDLIREWRESTASPILGPVPWLSSGTATVAWRPVDGLDLRVEYRHDHAASDAYFGGAISTDLVTGAAIPNRHAQDTITGGVIAWF